MANEVALNPPQLLQWRRSGDRSDWDPTGVKQNECEQGVSEKSLKFSLHCKQVKKRNKRHCSFLSEERLAERLKVQYDAQQKDKFNSLIINSIMDDLFKS